MVFNRLTLDAERELMRLVSYVCFYYAMAGWIKTEEEFIVLFKTLMVSTVAVALFGFYQLLIGDYSVLYTALYPAQDELLKVPAWSGRITSFLSHYNALAGYLNLIIPFCIGFALLAHDRTLRNLSRWCLVFSGVALVLTQSRGGLLALVAILVLSAYFFAPSRKVGIQSMAIVLVCAVLAALLAGLVFQRLSQIDDYTTVSRLAIWAGATNVFAGAPSTGMGFGNLRSFMGGLVFAAFAAICGVLVHGTVDYLFHTTPQATALFFMVLGILKANDARRQCAP